MTERSDFIVDSFEAVSLCLVRDEAEFRDPSPFPPDMSHQIFGASEKIYGYKNLKVILFYTASKLDMYISISYDEKVSDDMAQPDDIEKIILESTRHEVKRTEKEFLSALKSDGDFTPIGKVVPEFPGEVDGRKFVLYKGDLKSEQFLEHHSRMEPFLLWYIDAASYIDTADDRWDVFVLYEIVQENGKDRYLFVGLASAYNYFAYPDQLRPRISQLLVMPPFQRLSLASRMLSTLYFHYKSQNIKDINVERPCDEFQRLRDFVDASLCKDLPAFSSSAVQDGYCKDMFKAANDFIKINEHQSRRVCEILRLLPVDLNDLQQLAIFKRSMTRSRISNLQKWKHRALSRLPANFSQRKQIEEEFDSQAKDIKEKVDYLLECYSQVVRRMIEVPNFKQVALSNIPA